MRSYKLEGYSIARVWTKECPVTGHTPYEGTIIEISIPRGGMCEYGLLGGTLQNRHTGLFDVVIPLAGIVWDVSLVKEIDTVRTGLPAEYSAAIVVAAEQRAAESKLMQDVQFDCACHGQVGSSSRLFGRLACAVVSILADPSIAEDDEQMKVLLEEVRTS